MAATSILAILAALKAPFTFQKMGRDAVYDIDVTDPDLSGIETVETHNLVEVPVGQALIGAKLIVLESFTSAGAATVQFSCNSHNLGGALPKADLAKGDVVDLPVNDAEDTAGGALYAHTTALSIDMTVGTAALTAGRFLLIPEFVDVSACTTNG